eukprot:TRINITY_DN14851_c0_g1_i11.p2 TRINITY_DN14851_c0_g1~~TRINITY_DN14851_c0_g1_i11.p2  ORF type:complete len:101 (+),score=45.13 TRINITY_DN14851_c0_g1_i11:159-461(+)
MEDNKKIVIRSMDISTEMQQDAANCVQYVFELYGDPKRKLDITGKEEEVARKIKEEFDVKHNPTWHCIVGRSFGSYVTYEMKNCINLYKGPFSVLLWKID